MDPFQPRLPLSQLDAIKSWLQTHGPDVALYLVRNALYIPLQVASTVKLRSGYDPNYYLAQLNTDLIRFLAPWAFDEGADIRFGDTLYAGQILNFIEERPYIDYITDLELRYTDPEGRLRSAREVLRADRPDVIWASNTEHDLRLAGEQTLRRPRGIGAMTVAVDFIVD